jgi:glycerol uptake facilitator protein
MDEKILRACMAELIGTFAFVFLSATAVCVSYYDVIAPSIVAKALISGLTTGLVYAAALAVTVPLSGGYLNPAVTVVLWVFRRLPGGKTVGLLIAQLLGSALAGAALYFLVSLREDIALASHIGAPQMSNVLKLSSVSLIKGIGVELILTGILVFVVFGTAIDRRVTQSTGGWFGRLSFVWIGLATAAATIVGSPLTGGALNPARWFGPAVWDFQQGASLQDHPVYWVGPIAGALLTGWIYTALILPAEEEERVSHAGTPRSGTAATAAVGSGLARSKK